LALVAILVLGCSSTEQTTVRHHLQFLGASLDMYRMDHHRYPGDVPGLRALVGPDPLRPEGYIKELPVDPWGSAYQYRQDGSGSRRPMIYSVGPNRIDEVGGGDDIRVRNVDDEWR
jgi:general secretion pathway protein G